MNPARSAKNFSKIYSQKYVYITIQNVCIIGRKSVIKNFVQCSDRTGIPVPEKYSGIPEISSPSRPRSMKWIGDVFGDEIIWNISN